MLCKAYNIRKYIYWEPKIKKCEKKFKVLNTNKADLNKNGAVLSRPVKFYSHSIVAGGFDEIS